MIGNDFEILAVEPVEAPENMSGANWFRYTIGQGVNRIFGYRQGDQRSVEKSVGEIVLRLNERRIGQRGRVHLDMSSRGKPGRKSN